MGKTLKELIQGKQILDVIEEEDGNGYLLKLNGLDVYIFGSGEDSSAHWLVYRKIEVSDGETGAIYQGRDE